MKPRDARCTQLNVATYWLHPHGARPMAAASVIRCSGRPAGVVAAQGDAAPLSRARARSISSGQTEDGQ